MKERKLWQRVGSFLAGKGFYIVLTLCVAAIAVSGFYLYRMMDLTRQFTAAAVAGEETVTVDSDAWEDLPAAVQEPEAEEPQAEEPAQEAQPEPESEQAQAEEATAPAVVETQEPEASEPRFVWPLAGPVSQAFSDQELTYNEALGDWRTHPALDIAANLGDPVCAAADGTVISVREEPVLGLTVTIQHEDGFVSTYSNLSQEDLVEAGTRVSAGDPIGAVGQSAAGESRDTPWLHFTLSREGAALDPMDYLESGS